VVLGRAEYSGGGVWQRINSQLDEGVLKLRAASLHYLYE